MKYYYYKVTGKPDSIGGEITWINKTCSKVKNGIMPKYCCLKIFQRGKDITNEPPDLTNTNIWEKPYDFEFCGKVEELTEEEAFLYLL